MEPDERVAVSARNLPRDEGVVGEDLHGHGREGLVGAGVTQVNLQRHFWVKITESSL